MKIMLLGNRHSGGHFGTFIRGAVKLGHVVSHIPTRRMLEMVPVEKRKDKYKEFLRLIEFFNPDAIIHCQAWTTPLKVIEQFKEIAPTIYWTVDDPHQYITERHKNIWQNYEGILTCCKKCVSIYENYGIPAFLFYPPMVDPTTFYPRRSVGKYGYDIGFTFSALYIKRFWNRPMIKKDDHMEIPEELWFTEYVPRNILMEQSIKYGSVLSVGLRHKFYNEIPVSLMKMVDPMANEFLSDVFSSCKINVNSHAWPTYEGYLNKRTWLILASGGFQLCDEVNGIREIFTPGEHLVTYSNLKEYEDKLKYYLKHEEEREKIARQGYKYVIKNYRNDIMVGQVVKWLEKTYEI